jgi:hypothetical protein
MTTEKVLLNIATDFTRTPGPRKRTEGVSSGQEFLEDFLRPLYLAAVAKGSVLHVDFDGAAGYPTSFLEEAFGGLSREFGKDAVLSHIEFVCNDEPYLSDEIRQYIRAAKKR